MTSKLNNGIMTAYIDVNPKLGNEGNQFDVRITTDEPIYKGREITVLDTLLTQDTYLAGELRHELSRMRSNIESDFPIFTGTAIGDRAKQILDMAAEIDDLRNRNEGLRLENVNHRETIEQLRGVITDLTESTEKHKEENNRRHEEEIDSLTTRHEKELTALIAVTLQADDDRITDTLLQLYGTERIMIAKLQADLELTKADKTFLQEHLEENVRILSQLS